MRFLILARRALIGSLLGTLWGAIIDDLRSPLRRHRVGDFPQPPQAVRCTWLPDPRTAPSRWRGGFVPAQGGFLLLWGTMISVHRASAMLLLALFSFSLISPAVFASDADSKLPACCRRNGKHHCTTMATESESSSVPSVQAARCPFFPAVEGFPANRTVALTRISHAGFHRFVGHLASAPRTESHCHSSYSRAGQKRGPPTFIS